MELEILEYRLKISDIIQKVANIKIMVLDQLYSKTSHFEGWTTNNLKKLLFFLDLFLNDPLNCQYSSLDDIKKIYSSIENKYIFIIFSLTLPCNNSDFFPGISELFLKISSDIHIDQYD